MNPKELECDRILDEMRELDRIDKLEVENAELRDVLREALAMLEIYYEPNSDGTTPTITRIKQTLAKRT